MSITYVPMQRQRYKYPFRAWQQVTLLLIMAGLWVVDWVI